MTPGQKLQKAFSDTQVTSWVEPLRWEDFGEAAHARYEAAARRFLELIREPTDEMEEAADEPFHAAWKYHRERSMKLYGKEAYGSAAFSDPIWKAMIDALIKEPT